MLKKRLSFLKRMYGDYVVLFSINKKIYIFDHDQKIIKYFKKGNIIQTLAYYHINYIIIDNLNITDKVEFGDNKYKEFFIKSSLLEFLLSKI